jgi:DNA-binding SARP family transcriptional activator/tetratricopeptide (TPR) repeat protein
MVEHLGVRLLGDFELVGADLAALRSRKARILLKVLALADGATVRTDDLVDAVWGRELTSDPAGDLAVLVSRARAIVGADRLARREQGYALRLDSSDRTDLDELAAEARRRADAADIVGARVALGAALALIRGPLLAEEGDAPWVAAPREHAAALEAEVRLLAAETSLAAGQPVEALEQARLVMARDPYDERALRVMMRAHVAVGRPASALAAYAAARERLAEDLGVSPTADTEALHTMVLVGDTAEARPSPSGPVLVGRAGELARLDAALERSRAAAEVVIVEGEPGVGKSAVLQAWAAACRARGVSVGIGRADGYLDVALQPIVDALSTLGAGLDGRTPLGTALPAPVLRGAALDLERFVELTAAFASVRDRRGGSALAVVLDDGDRMDTTTRAWLRHVLRRPAEHRFVVVVAWADGEPLDIAASVRLRLEPLPVDAIAELVGAERAPDLWRRTNGNPLLLVELAGNGTTDELPATLRDAVGARLLHAGEAAGTLRTAAVLGGAIDLDLLAGLCGEPATKVLGHVDEGLRRGFLVEREGTIEFRHGLVRDALAAGTTAPRRAWIHREAARLLSQRLEPNPLEVARHARLGGDDALAAEGLTAAAAIARSRLDIDGAEAMLDEAIERCDHVAARLQRARTRMAHDDLVGAEEDALEAQARGAGAEALELRAWAARNRHDMQAAMRLGRAGAAAASDPTTRASCQLAVALAHRGVGELQQAGELLAAIAGSEPDPSIGLDAWIGALRVHQGAPDEALALLEPLLGSPAGPMHSFWVEHVLQMTAHAYGMVGRVTDALVVVDRLDRELDRRGTSVRYAGVQASYRSWLLRSVGEPSAVDAAEEAVDIAASSEIRTQARLDLADALLLLRGDLDAADRALRRGEADMEVRWFHNRWRCEQRAGLLRARLLLAGGDVEGAARHASAVEAAATARGDERYRLLGLLIGACATVSGGALADGDPAPLVAEAKRVTSVAGAESWWLLDDLARTTGLAVLRRRADEAASAAVLAAGRHAPALRVELARRAATLRSR